MFRALDSGITYIGNEVARATAACLRHPAITLAFYVLVSILLGLGATRLDRVSSFLGFLPEEDREVASYREFLEEYASDDLVLVASRCPGPAVCRSVLDPQALSALRRIEERLRSVPGVQQVTGLLSAPVFEGDDAFLYARRLGELDPRDAEGIREIGQKIVADPRLRGSIISPDERTAGIVVRCSSSQMSEEERLRFVEAIRGLTDRFEAETGMTTYVVGDVVAESLVNRYTREDLALLTPLMFALVLAIFGWLFRDFTAAVAPLVAIGVATVVPFGLMGLLGIPITVLSSALPILVVVIGVTDSMHLVTRFFHHAERGESTASALETTAGELGVPSLVTALTGSAGLLSFSLSPMPHFREFGLFSALGVFAAFATTFTLLPVLFLALPPRSRPRPSLELAGRALVGVHRFSTGRSGIVLIGSIVLAVGGLAGILDLRVQNDWLRIVDSRDYIYRSEQFVRENLRPTRTVEILLEARDGENVTDSIMLGEVRAVADRLRGEPRFGRVDSVLSLIRQVHDLASAQDTEPEELPATAAEISETLFLATSAAPELVRSFLSVDQKVVRLSVGFHYSDSRTDLALLERLRGDIRSIAPSWEPSITGLSSLNPRIGELVLETQLTSFSGAFVTIFVVIAILVGSLRLAALGMIPNLLPVVMILGLMGYWSIGLDVGTAMVATILIGISVDDTVYFLVHYRAARLRGESTSDAVRYAFEFSGRAALFSTLILASGFVLLGFSRFRSLAYFGFLSSLAVVLAALAEFLVLPAVLMGATRMQEWVRERRA
jgi:predicted RND superfamily exporter protein